VRSYRDVWFWLGGLFLTLFVFLAAVAIAYFLKQANYSLFINGWMLGALICFLAAYTCFFGAIKGWAFPPVAKAEFPGIEVEIYGTGSLDTQRESESGLSVPATLRSFNARFASTAASQDASLTVLLYVKLGTRRRGRLPAAGLAAAALARPGRDRHAICPAAGRNGQRAPGLRDPEVLPR
jgi:hypothetical protein